MRECLINFSVLSSGKNVSNALTKLRKASWEQASISSYTVPTITSLLIGKVNLCLEKRPLSTFFSSSIIFSGSTFVTFRKPAEFSGLNFINSDTFYRILRCLAIPAIKHVLREEINSAREEISKNNLVILCDSRFDSPGKSA